MDKCLWLAGHHITGSLASGALAYEDYELPAPGEAGCFIPCGASATLLVNP